MSLWKLLVIPLEASLFALIECIFKMYDLDRSSRCLCSRKTGLMLPHFVPVQNQVIFFFLSLSISSNLDSVLLLCFCLCLSGCSLQKLGVYGRCDMLNCRLREVITFILYIYKYQGYLWNIVYSSIRFRSTFTVNKYLQIFILKFITSTWMSHIIWKRKKKTFWSSTYLPLFESKRCFWSKRLWSFRLFLFSF